MTAFIDLFSGIGGFALAAYWAGLRFDKHYFSEIEPYAVELYKKRFPEAEHLGDIKNVDYSKLPKGEWLVTGGFPCTPHSDAGLKKGADDERDLWPECRRMLRELRPRIALFENVRGLFTSPGREQKGEFFNGVLSDIHDSGYACEWQVISAADVGAPHLRKRVWIVCYASGGGRGGEPQRGSGPEPSDGHLQLETRTVAYSDDAGDRTYGNGTDGGRQEKNEGREKQPQPEPRGHGADVADAGEVGLQAQGTEQQTTGTAGIRQDVANADSERLQGRLGGGLQECSGEQPVREGGTSMADSEGFYVQGQHNGQGQGEFGGSGWWAVESDVGRVAHGIPSRVDRLKGLGNAIVPQCAEMIFNLPAFDRWRIGGINGKNDYRA